MKNKKHPALSWLEKQANNKAIVQKYLEEYLLAEIYTPTVFRVAREDWNFLPFYVTQNLDPETTTLIQNPVPHMQKAINQYWIRRAIQVLSGYSDCPVPLSKDPRGIGAKRDLLSKKGHQWLQILEQAIKEGRTTEQVAAIARSAARKSTLNLDLFIDLNCLKPLARNTVPLTHEDFKDVQVALTSGCYNGCVHCGFDAKAPVAHMPYPIFLKAMKIVLHTNTKNDVQYLHNDSDSISYYDSVINADVGDIVLALSGIRKQQRFGFMTKGVLTKRDEIAFAKVIHHRRRFQIGEENNLVIGISLIDLPGEAVAKNLERVKRTHQIAHRVNGQSIPVAHRYFWGMEQISSKELSSLEWVSAQIEFDSVGRMPQLVERVKEQYPSFELTPTNMIMASNFYLVNTDLIVYDIYREGDKYVRQPLCSVLDTEFLARLDKPQRVHPTIAREKPIAKNKKAQTLLGALCQTLTGRTPN